MDQAGFARQAISVPFLVGGRDWSGWDCWGLVFVAHRELLGVDIPVLAADYDLATSFAELGAVVDRERPAWAEVEKPAFGDVALFKISRFETHVAFVLDRGLMLHCLHGAGTLCERLDTLTWARRRAGYFRHRDR